MSIQYVVTPEEMQGLIDSLDLARLRERDNHAPNSVVHKQDIDNLHRTFHFYVVRWTQAMGHKGFR